MDLGTNDLKKLLCVSTESGEDKLENEVERVSYNKDTLIILSHNATCNNCPGFLSSNYFSDNGRWDPELWIQSFSPSSTERMESRPQEMKRFDGSVGREDSNVVLGPQRRSFQGGCVSWKQGSSFSRSNSTKIPDRKVLRQQSQERESQHPGQLKRFHSLDPTERNSRDSETRSRGNNSESWSFEKSDHYRKPRQSDYKKFSAPIRDFSRRSDNSRQQYNEIEEEPEWISYGPKSQFDTIELAGFEEADDFSWMGGEIPMDDVREKKKKEPESEDTPAERPVKQKESAAKEIKNGTEKTPNSNKKTSPPATPEETNEALKAKENAPEVSITDNTDLNNQSRFSRWFSKTPDEEKSKLDSLESPHSDASGKEGSDNKDNVNAVPNVETPEETPSTTVGAPTLSGSIITASQPVQTSSSQPSSSRSSELHSTDAFNRLIASLRQSDKEKEQIQQRNQQIQALQSIMKTTQLRAKDNCYNVSSIEEPDLFGKDLSQTSLLKKQLEKQKDAYHQKLRQMEQSQNRSPVMFPGQDNQDGNQGIGENFYKSHNDVHDERAAATASLKAKLAGKTKKDESSLQSGLGDRMSVNQNMDLKSPLQEMPTGSAFGDKKLSVEESLMKLKLLQSAPSGIQSEKLKKQFPTNIPNNPNKNTQHQRESALLIAQMLAKAGVTEEQLKQLTIEQQELVIAMVQNQYSQKEIGKMMGKSGTIKLLEAQKGNGNNRMSANNITSSYLAMNNSGARDSRANNSTSSANILSYINDKRTVAQESRSASSNNYNHGHNLSQSRVLPQGVIPQYPIMSHMVPHLMGPHLVPQAMPPHLMHSSPTAIPAHPAMLLQMQQLYASQLAQQQQHQASVLAALQQQQFAAQVQPNDLSKLQQNIQNLRMGSRPTPEHGDRSQFTNPLSQWFSRDVLQQSQFPPVSQLTGQHNLNFPGSGNQGGKH